MKYAILVTKVTIQRLPQVKKACGALTERFISNMQP